MKEQWSLMLIIMKHKWLIMYNYEGAMVTNVNIYEGAMVTKINNNKGASNGH